MNAKAIFEKLGYNLIENDNYSIEYYNEQLEAHIYFYKMRFTVEFVYEATNEFNMNELQAINKQIEELGWLDERNNK